MATQLIRLPDVGEGVAEAEIAEWHVAVGDHVREDQVLAAVMTDKATVEIPSPVAGTVVECAAEVGAMIAVGAKLVVIEVDEAGAGDEKMRPEPSRPTGTASKTKGERPDEAAPQVMGARALAAPAVRKRALDAGIDLHAVRGSGPAGRITHADLDAVMSGGMQSKSVAPRTPVEEIRLTGLRKTIAERMADAHRRIAAFSYVEEVDVTNIEDLRAELNDRHAGERGKLTLLPFILRALTVAMPEFPQMNAHFDDERQVVIRHAALHAGIATQTEAGLMVPVLRHAEDKDLWELAESIRRLAEAARSGRASRDELGGSTITVTSLGDLGGIVSTPVINPPEVAIIGINRIAVRPVWQEGRFVPRRMMNLSSTFDHRIIDGQDAAMFIRRLKALLEMPALLFIEG